MPGTATELALAALDHVLSLLRNGVGGPLVPSHVGVVEPRAAADLPALVVTIDDLTLPAVGLGGIVGLQRGLVGGIPTDLGAVESARAGGTFTMQIWGGSAAEVEQIVRALAAVGLEGVIRRNDDIGAGRRTVECLARFTPRGLGPTSRPAPGSVEGAGATDVFVRRLAFSGLYERTIVPLVQDGPAIRQIPVTYDTDTGTTRVVERESIGAPSP